MGIQLGSKPHQIEAVNLHAGTDFVAILRNRDDSDYAPGTSAELVFDGTTPTTWTATLSGSALVFDEDEVAVNALIAKNPKRAKLFHINGTTRLPWARGPVRVYL